MDVGALRTFAAVAEWGSFSRAADVLMVAQPAVSQQIKRLERELGVALFTRSTRRVELTDPGRALLPRAQAVLAEVRRAQEDVALLRAGLAGRVAVGFVGTATYDLLPRLSRSVRADLPGIELELFGEQLSPALVEALLDRRIDIAVMRNPEVLADVRVHPLRREQLVAALPADHRLAGADRVALGALRDEVFVTHPSGHRSVMYQTVMQACRRAGFLPSEVVEVRETATLVAFVAAGIGVALVPDAVRSLAVAGVVYRSLSDVTTETEVVLAVRADESSQTVARVVRAAREAAG